MLKKAGVFILIAVFILSIAGAAFAAPPWLEDGSKKIPPGQLKKIEEGKYKQTGPPAFVLQKQQEKQMRFLDKKQIRICGKELKSDLPPVIKEGRTLIPVRAVIMGLGAEIAWDKEKGLVTVTKGNITVEFYIDDVVFYINGKKHELDIPAQLINNRTFVPLRYLAEALGKRVKYDDDNDVITIGDDVLKKFEVGGMDVLELDGIEVDAYDDDGAVLKVSKFEDFEGIEIETQDKENISFSVYLNGFDDDDEIDEDELDELSLENGDVIFVRAEVSEKEDGNETVTTYYYKVTLVGLPSAAFVFTKPSGLVETDEDIPGFSVTVKNVRNIEDDVPLRYLMEVTSGDLDGKVIEYGDAGKVFVIDDDQAYFGPSSGFTLDDLPELMNEDGITIPFTILDGLDEGTYRFKISIVEVGGDPLVTSKEFTIKVDPETDK
ncbi:MAG: hypothetical protein GX263_06795 [Firmicutes bacterium]|jgi:hypothetical protein|nr:hypothetical protein [Bacillota bacterium]